MCNISLQDGDRSHAVHLECLRPKGAPYVAASASYQPSRDGSARNRRFRQRGCVSQCVAISQDGDAFRLGGSATIDRKRQRRKSTPISAVRRSRREGQLRGMGRHCYRLERAPAVRIESRPSPKPRRVATSRRFLPFAAPWPKGSNRLLVGIPGHASGSSGRPGAGHSRLISAMLTIGSSQLVEQRLRPF